MFYLTRISSFTDRIHTFTRFKLSSYLFKIIFLKRKTTLEQGICINLSITNCFQYTTLLYKGSQIGKFKSTDHDINAPESGQGPKIYL